MEDEKREFDVAALYKEHRETAYWEAYFVLKAFGAQNWAEDVVHEVFASLKEPALGKVRNWKAYLRKAARNQAVSMERDGKSPRLAVTILEHLP